MANTTAVYARIDTKLKDNAESILSQLGISPSSAIQMLYSQIVLKKGIPFDLKLPSSEPLAVGAMTKKQIDKELQKGVVVKGERPQYKMSPGGVEVAVEHTLLSKMANTFDVLNLLPFLPGVGETVSGSNAVLAALRR